MQNQSWSWQRSPYCIAPISVSGPRRGIGNILWNQEQTLVQFAELMSETLATLAKRSQTAGVRRGSIHTPTCRASTTVHLRNQIALGVSLISLISVTVNTGSSSTSGR